MVGGTIIIDDAAQGGSPVGAWATHIAHTPHLAAQARQQEFPVRNSGRSDCAQNAGDALSLGGGAGAGEVAFNSPIVDAPASPASPLEARPHA